MNAILSIAKVFLNKAVKIYESQKYNDISIAEKFRKQGARIGQACEIQIRELSAEPYLVEIGNNVYINSNVSLFTHDGASSIFRSEIPYLQYFGKIKIEDNCFIGYNAMIFMGVTIGANSIIGAGAVVMSDVKPGSVMVGNPAMRVSTTEKYRQRCLDEWKNQGLTKFERMFEGKDKDNVEKMMRSHTFREELKNHLLKNTSSKLL